MRASPRALHESESGLALVVLLAVVLFVAVVGVAMADNVVRETQIAVNESTAVQARYLAEAGIADAAAHLNQDNTWKGPITQSLGAGSYTVQVDPNVSQPGALGAVKSVVSTGTVFYSGTTPTQPQGVSAATQTVRVTLLVLPQAFSKALTSGTVVTMGNTSANGAVPTISNTVLRQLGAIQANNAQTEASAFKEANASTTVTGQVTYVTGTTTINGTCIACSPAKVATVPVPHFNVCPSATTCTTQSACPSPSGPNDPYSCKAFNSASPCPVAIGGPQDNMNFATQAIFDSCVAKAPLDAQGFVNFTGTVFVNEVHFFLPDKSSPLKFRFTGTLVTYNSSSSGCSATAPCGDIIWVNWVSAGNNIIINATKGEPAALSGGQWLTGNGTCGTTLSPGTLTITGLVVVLANSTDPSVTSIPTGNPGYCVHGSSTIPVTIDGAVYAGRVFASSKGDGFDSNSLTYDPSIFFPGLPSAMVAPTAPFVMLPLSWSSAK